METMATGIVLAGMIGGILFTLGDDMLEAALRREEPEIADGGFSERLLATHDRRNAGGRGRLVPMDLARRLSRTPANGCQSPPEPESFVDGLGSAPANGASATRPSR
jgi:hypothetical protein